MLQNTSNTSAIMSLVPSDEEMYGYSAAEFQEAEVTITAFQTYFLLCLGFRFCGLMMKQEIVFSNTEARGTRSRAHT